MAQVTNTQLIINSMEKLTEEVRENRRENNKRFDKLDTDVSAVVLHQNDLAHRLSNIEKAERSEKKGKDANWKWFFSAFGIILLIIELIILYGSIPVQTLSN